MQAFANKGRSKWPRVHEDESEQFQDCDVP